MSTGYQINGKDLDDLLQKRKGTGCELPTPTYDFTGYQVNGSSLAGTYAKAFKPWHKKMERSYLSNGQEIDACLKGYYPLDRSFANYGAGTYTLTRTDSLLKLSPVNEWGPNSVSAFDGVIPSVVLIAICAGGGRGGNGTGTKSAGGGGGGAMGMYVLDFTVSSSFTITVGGASGQSTVKANATSQQATLNAGGSASGQNGGSAGTKSLSSGTAIREVDGTWNAGAGGYDNNNGWTSRWNWWWGSSSTKSGDELSTRTGELSGGTCGSYGGAGGGSSFGKGGNGGDPARSRTNGGGGGGGNYGWFNGKSGASGGAGYFWLYY